MAGGVAPLGFHSCVIFCPYCRSLASWPTQATISSRKQAVLQSTVTCLISLPSCNNKEKKNLIFSCTAHVDIILSFFQNHPPHKILYHPSKRRPGLPLKSQTLWATLGSNQTPSFLVVVLSSRKARSGRIAVSPFSDLAVICRVSFLEHSTHCLVGELCADTVPLK